MEELDIDGIVDVPDTPDRLSRRRVIGRESMGRDRDSSSLMENFRSRESKDSLFENHVNGLRAKDNNNSGAQNGHRRKPVIRPPKSSNNNLRTTSFGNVNGVSSEEEDSLASRNGRLFRKAALDESSSHTHRVKSTDGVRNMDKGKSVSIGKPSSYQEGTDFFDLTKRNEFAGNSKPFCLNSAPRQMSLSGSSSEMFRNGFRGNEKIGESSPKGSGLATTRRETIVLSPDSQHKTREHSSPISLSSPRVPGRKCLVKNGCISPQNIAKAEQRNGSSKSIEPNRIVNGSSSFTTSPIDIIHEVVADENDSGRRKKGKATLSIPGISKKHNENPIFATSSIRGTDSREAYGANGFRDDGVSGWRSTHNHSRKQDNVVPDAAEHYSGRIRSEIQVDRRERYNPSEGENDVTTTAASLFETGQSSGRPRAEKTVAKKPKKQVLTSSSRGECSTSMSEDTDVLFLGPSRESRRPRPSRAQHPRSRATLDPVIELDEFSPLVRRSAPQNMECTNNDDSDIRAMQVEADEMLARELQEQLYHEMPMVGGGELDEHLAWALQQENSSNTSGARQTASHSRQPRLRSAIQSRPSRRGGGIRSQVPSSSRMAQIRGRAPRRHTVSTRTSNLQFPLDMDLDMRLDILEALENAVEDVHTGNPIYQVQWELNENDYEMLLALDEQNHQHTGASRNVINSLPQSIVQTDNQEACAICLENPTVGETVRHLPCFHMFHKDCIDPWLSRKTSCPVCKLSVA